MALRAFNTLTRRKEDLAPGRGGEMRIYVCGVTVYDFSHVGHARSALAFDMIRRYLLFRGYQVKFVRNFTDVDDKIIRRANQEGVTAQEISERYIAEYRADLASLGVSPAVATASSEGSTKVVGTPSTSIRSRSGASSSIWWTTPPKPCRTRW